MFPPGCSPRALGLPSHDEITAMEHVEMLRLNGFELQIDDEAAVGERVKLVAQPVSKDTVFGVSGKSPALLPHARPSESLLTSCWAADLEELLDRINGAAAGEVVRPSKARKMFASRACRKSVMIGKALNTSQMTAVVRHMGTMDQPWVSWSLRFVAGRVADILPLWRRCPPQNCPHGRPTMRWVRPSLDRCSIWVGFEMRRALTLPYPPTSCSSPTSRNRRDRLRTTATASTSC